MLMALSNMKDQFFYGAQVINHWSLDSENMQPERIIKQT
jgi:hypothetical protein